ncbi:ABC transporter ATP-binding protein [Williamsia sp. M5A3_1d]
MSAAPDAVHAPAIEATDLVREYRMGEETVRALDGLTLRLDGGQFVSVVGPSGAGKSTLLHVIGALDAPDSGRIVVSGSDIGSLNDDEQSEFRRRTIGFIFQFFNLVPTMSAWENVALPRLLDGTSLRKSKADAVALLDRVGLGNRAGHRPSELSGGQMQRVAIARSLIMDPRIVLADEPTGNLDSHTGASILGLLAELAHDDSGRLVLMVTHDTKAAEFADTTVTVRDGRIEA